MANYLFVALKVSKECQNDRVKIDNVNLDNPVAEFFEKMLENEQVQTKLSTFNRNLLNFVYCGLILEKENSLKSYGIESGVTVFLITRKEHKIEIKKAACRNLDRFLKSLDCSKFRKRFIEVLSLATFIDPIINEHRGILTDPIALSILRDPELLMNVFVSNNFDKMVENHPTFELPALEAAKRFMALASTNEELPVTNSAFSYSLQAMSDEDLSDFEDSIAEEGQGESNQDDDDDNDTLITSDMLEGALLSAMETTRSLPSAELSSNDTSDDLQLSSQQSTDSFLYESQLQQMHELGFLDDAINRSALSVSSGNIQEAINLVLLWS